MVPALCAPPGMSRSPTHHVAARPGVLDHSQVRGSPIPPYNLREAFLPRTRRTNLMWNPYRADDSTHQPGRASLSKRKRACMATTSPALPAPSSPVPVSVGSPATEKRVRGRGGGLETSSRYKPACVLKHRHFLTTRLPHQVPPRTTSRSREGRTRADCTVGWERAMDLTRDRGLLAMQEHDGNRWGRTESRFCRTTITGEISAKPPAYDWTPRRMRQVHQITSVQPTLLDVSDDMTHDRYSW